MGFSDVHFVGSHGWITGGNGKLYYTSNEANPGTFKIQTLPTPAGISNSVFIRSLTEGYAVTSTGRVFHASDPVSGNWSLIKGSPDMALYSVSFPPSGTGYACGNSGSIYSVTSSAVVLDTIIGTETFTSIFFSGFTHGWVCGTCTIRHKNNGIWLDDQNYYAGNSYNSIYFTDNSNGWAVGSDGKIIHTADGINWNGQISPTTNTLNDVFFLNTQEGWAVGTNVILHTTNGGTTWNIEASELTSGKLLTAVYFTSSTKGYVVGRGVLLKFSK